MEIKKRQLEIEPYIDAISKGDREQANVLKGHYEEWVKLVRKDETGSIYISLRTLIESVRGRMGVLTPFSSVGERYLLDTLWIGGVDCFLHTYYKQTVPTKDLLMIYKEFTPTAEDVPLGLQAYLLNVIIIALYEAKAQAI